MTDYLPRRVVSLQPSATSTLDALGVLDRVVACTRHCAAVAPGVKELGVAVVEDSWTAQTGQIVAAKPDLVIASVPYQVEAIAQILASGTRVLALSPRSLEDVYHDIATIANLMGVAGKGTRVISDMRDVVANIRRRTNGCARPRVFCEEWGKPIIVAQPWVAELVEAAGGRFCGTPGTTTSAEPVAASNPDVIVFGWCGIGDRVPAEKMIKERAWQNLSAVRSGCVLVVRDEFLTTPGPPLMTGALALAHAVHPEIFPDTPEFAGTNVMRRIEGRVF